ncbi:hypothetical protein JCGZ_08402 [Jatropha curcas]|uniref:Bet v I/Major latex protein domain-containing protein n=1 Tax=Jatropha curcas TaxID=180498 RepID=A0A067KMC3_JATCU|nr:hypothetical protein JCGZ_08402 [Jatropha curcas]
MGVVSYELVVTSSIPPAKLYKALVLDADTLLPKIVPEAFESSQFKYSKHKIEAIDKENFKFSHSVIEGDMLMNVIEKITYDIELEQSPDGGCVCKESSKYYTIGDFELNADQIKAGKEKALGLFKAVEAYLLANPNAC